MSTRTIVTSQPDVACGVCERRLLRGEQPDVFIAAGRRLIVCELCAPRASHEGWMRESDGAQIALPPLRPRRGRSFLDRLRQVARQPAEPAPGSAEAPGLVTHDLLAGEEVGAARGVDAGDRAVFSGWAAAEEPHGSAAHDDEATAVAPADRSYVERAVDVFNASEFPRRIAGVARSLGAPEVSVRSAEHLSSVVVIVIAWELCWYRYEVDLSDGPGEARVLEQGTELAELPHDDRLANALTADSGALVLAPAAR